MKDKKIIQFPSKDNEIKQKANEHKDETTTIKITNKKLLSSKSDDSETKIVVIDLEEFYKILMNDAPDFEIGNLSIYYDPESTNQKDFPTDPEEYDKQCDIEAKALIHTLSYVPFDTLTKFIEYSKQFIEYYEKFDAEKNYPKDQNHEYFEFFNACKEAAKQLKNKKNKD